MWATALWDHEMVPLQWGIVIGASLVGAVWDARARRIPNLLTGSVLVAGLVWASWTAGLAGFGEAAAGCIILSSPYVLLFLFASGGAGDAKLMGAVGAWLGIINGLVVLVAVAVSGVILGLAFAAGQKRLRVVFANLAYLIRMAYLFFLSRGRWGGIAEESPDHGDRQKMPYALAIFVGVCVAAVGVFLWRQS